MCLRCKRTSCSHWKTYVLSCPLQKYKYMSKMGKKEETFQKAEPWTMENNGPGSYSLQKKWSLMSRDGSVPVTSLGFRRHQMLLLVPREALELSIEKNMAPSGYCLFSLGPEWIYMEQSHRPGSVTVNVSCMPLKFWGLCVPKTSYLTPCLVKFFDSCSGSCPYWTTSHLNA